MAISTGAGRTFGGIFEANGGGGPGFRLLRIGLAVSIYLSHASFMAGNHHLLSSVLESVLHIHRHVAAGVGHAMPEHPATLRGSPAGVARPYVLGRVPMFFALSGFLVTSSALRTRNVLRFLGLRALRIFPALAVSVTLSAVVLGLLFTTLRPIEYLTHPEFFRYFGNSIGFVYAYLPGVFKSGSPTTAVNGSLWTLPVELGCYIGVSVLMLLGIIYNRKAFTILYVAITISLIWANTWLGMLIQGDALSGVAMIHYFMTGVLIYQWREKIPHSWLLFAAAVAAYVVLSYSRRMIFICPIALAYFTMFVGMLKLPKLPLISRGDYSYGIYLYGYPITHAVIAALPFVRGNLILISLVGLTSASLFAVLSWHLIEKKALKLKQYISPRPPAVASGAPSTATAAEALVRNHRRNGGRAATVRAPKQSRSRFG